MKRPDLVEYTTLDRLVIAVDGWLRARGSARGSHGGGASLDAEEPCEGDVAHSPSHYPAEGVEDDLPGPESRRRSGRLMRVNHAGEVAAQALYLGQQVLARDAETREALDRAAHEERAHLEWCRRRLSELGTATSRLDPLWWAGSFAIGTAAGALGDRWSLGFVAETERQVEEHLARHLELLPPGDHRSRAICRQMMEEEKRHGTRAAQSGGRTLPAPARAMMRAAARIMTSTAYRF